MKDSALKMELMDWLSQLEDNQTLNYLKMVKDADEVGDDWWHSIPEEQKEGILCGLKDIDEGRLVAHHIVAAKYGL